MLKIGANIKELKFNLFAQKV